MHTHGAAVAWQMSSDSLICNNSITRYHPNLESLTHWGGFFKGWGVLAGPRGSDGVCRCSSPLKIKGFVQMGKSSPVPSSGQPGPVPPASRTRSSPCLGRRAGGMSIVQHKETGRGLNEEMQYLPKSWGIGRGGLARGSA